MSGEYLAKVTSRSDSARLSEKSILNPPIRPLSIRPMLIGLNPIAIKRAKVSIDSAEYQQTAKNSGDDRPWFHCASLVQNSTTIADVTMVVLDGIFHATEGYLGLGLFQSDSTPAYAMPSKRSVDIDTGFDIAMAGAETLLAERIRGGQ